MCYDIINQAAVSLLFRFKFLDTLQKLLEYRFGGILVDFQVLKIHKVSIFASISFSFLKNTSIKYYYSCNILIKKYLTNTSKIIILNID
jgi:hypothetical protein